MGTWPNPDQPTVRQIDPLTGLAGLSDSFSSKRPSDFPDVQVKDPEVSPSAGPLTNLSDAQQLAGEVGAPALPSSHLITLSGGGQPGSIFAATIDGANFSEKLYDSLVRTTSAAAFDIAQGLELQFPYLKAEASGSTIAVASMNPTLTIAAPATPIPLPIPTINTGTNLPRRGDMAKICINDQSVVVVFNGSETLPDMILQRVYDAIYRSPMRKLFRMESYFVGSYTDSYIYLAPWSPLTLVQVFNTGQIRLRLGPTNAGANNFGFSVT